VSLENDWPLRVYIHWQEKSHDRANVIKVSNIALTIGYSIGIGYDSSQNMGVVEKKIQLCVYNICDGWFGC